MNAKSPRYVLITATVITSIVLALVFSEVALRLMGFTFALYPTEVQFGFPDPVTLRNLFHIDKQLLWVDKDYHSKVANWEGEKPSIVFMGDSCTQFGTYDKILVSLFHEKHPHRTVSFVNVGVAGWSSYQGLQQLRRDVLPMRPRVITIYYGWNDHWTSFGIEDKVIGQFNLEHPRFLLTLSRARIVQLINRAIFNLKNPDMGRNQRRPERVSLSDFTSNLIQMSRIARDQDVIPVFLTAPSSHREGDEPAYLAARWVNNLHELVPLHYKYVQAVRDAASKEHVLLIDLYESFRRLPREEQLKCFQLDGIHLTEMGNRKIAEFMYDYFSKNDLIDRLIDDE